jgi:iron complex transport system ATP-binding protein
LKREKTPSGRPTAETSVPIFVDALEFSYGKSATVLNGLSMSVEAGKFYGVIGRNGCGKSTLLKNIARLMRSKNAKGSIIIDGKWLSGYSRIELSKKLACVNQREANDFDFTCHEIVLMGRTPYLSRLSAESARDIEIVNASMEKTNTLQFKDRSVNAISGGELQRVLIARALAQCSPILMLDEPVSALDISQQLLIMDTISGLCRSEKITVVCALHDINLAARYSDGIFLMKDGAVIMSGPPSEVITRVNLEAAYGVRAEVLISERTGRPFIAHYELAE